MVDHRLGGTRRRSVIALRPLILLSVLAMSGVLALVWPVPAAAYQGDGGIGFGRCPERSAGTEGPDTRFLAATEDGFDGLGGQDQINGLGGSDCLLGNFGNDTVNGGDGDDVVVGGPGQDSLQGATGNDDIDATEWPGTGTDSTVIAASGDDDIKADDGFPDTIDCGPGADRVDADAGDTVLGNCELRTDLIGADVYHAQHFGGDQAAAGDLLAEEWIVAGMKIARREIADMINTRTNVPCQDNVPTGPWCAELRWRTLESQFEGAGPDDLDTFAEHRGASQVDPNVDQIASLLDPIEFAAARRAPVATGLIADALASWQVPPPGHAATYEAYEVSGQFSYNSGQPDPVTGEFGDGVAYGTSTMRVWVDAATKLPLRETLTVAGESETSYWNYDSSVAAPASLPADFFRVAEPAEAALRQSVAYQADQPPAQLKDAQSATAFTPYTLGNQRVLAGQGLCLATTLVFKQSERGEDNADGRPRNVSPITRLDALYAPRPAHGPCRSGTGQSVDAVLTVTSVARTSSVAAAYRESVVPRSHMIAAPPTPAPMAATLVASSGRMGFEHLANVAYMAPRDGGGALVLADIGATTILVSGRFRARDAADLLRRLEGGS